MKYKKKVMQPKILNQNDQGPYLIIRELYNPLVKFIQENNGKMKYAKRITFKSIKENHIQYVKKLMEDNKTKDYCLEVKLKLVKDQFPGLKISRSTLWKVKPLYVLIK